MKIKHILLITLAIPFLSGCKKECNHSITIDQYVAPTCLESGLSEGSHCEKCGEILSSQEVLPALGHTPIIDEGIEATCEEDGLTYGVHCSRCNEIILEQTIIEHKGHDVVNDKKVEPTCDEVGYEEGSHCKTCNKVLSGRAIIPALGHIYKVIPGQDVTCEEDGLSEKIECERCHKIIKEAEVIIHEGHNILSYSKVEPTCEDSGRAAGMMCSKCGFVSEGMEFIPALGHDYVIDYGKEASCTEEGFSDGVHCARCEKVFLEQKCIDKKPHHKAELLSLPFDLHEGIKRPGLFYCDECENEFYDEVNFDDINMPVISIEGDMSGISKDVKKKVLISYQDEDKKFDYYSTIKWQGSSSLAYDKKNYNIQFFKDSTFESKQKIKMMDSWSKESKYTLKANYVDYSQARNIVSAKIYGDIVRSRDIEDNFNDLVNGGAIDGFPVLVYQNGSYLGLYTFNMAKESYLFNMKGGSDSKEAILMADLLTESVKLKENIPANFGNGWELEYASTEDDASIGTSWVSESMNRLINLLNCGDPVYIVSNLSKYLNIERTIDSMLYTWLIDGTDNTAKNILWVTYDGVQWSPSMYDMDGTWGMAYNGSVSYPEALYEPYDGNMAWQFIYTYYRNQVKARWEELRRGPLSLSNIDKHFVDFTSLIPSLVYESESLKWRDVKSQNNNHITQITKWVQGKLHNHDNSFGVVIDDIKPYQINFNSLAKVKVFRNSNLSLKSDETTIAFSRNENGYFSLEDASNYFEIILPEGKEIDSIIVDGDYESFKKIDNKKNINTYEIKNISSNVNVHISLK